MITIAILASGPPKPNRNRHLEIFNGKPCITQVINNCQINGIKLSVVISNKNIDLKNYLLKNHKEVSILETNDNSMKTTFEVAFYQDNNDTLIIAGDLWNLKKENIIKYINSKYKSAISLLKNPWGNDLISFDNSLMRRGDIDDSVFLISQGHQQIYLSDINIQWAIYYFNKFYPYIKFDINQGNHLWTWLTYVFFRNISANKNVNYINEDIGIVYIDDLIYLDND